MNRSQAVTAGVWYNPTPKQRRELAERAAAMRSPQRRRVQEGLRETARRFEEGLSVARFADIARIFGVRSELLGFPVIVNPNMRRDAMAFAPASQNARQAYERDRYSAASQCAADAAWNAGAVSRSELRAIRNMLDEVTQ